MHATPSPHQMYGTPPWEIGEAAPVECGAADRDRDAGAHALEVHRAQVITMPPLKGPA
jgi:hypothetical protein